MSHRFHVIGFAVTLLMIVTTAGCSSITVTQDGPLKIGVADGTIPNKVCMSDLPVGTTVWFGDRAMNSSNGSVVLTEVAAVDATGYADLKIRA